MTNDNNQQGDTTMTRDEYVARWGNANQWPQTEVELDEWLLLRIVEVSRAAMHALRSYQYGNSSLDLAEEIADSIEKTLTTIEQEGGRRG